MPGQALAAGRLPISKEAMTIPETRPLAHPKRFAALLKELDDDIRESRRKARRLEPRVAACWWGSLLLVGVASLAGFLAAVPAVQNVVSIQPWWISVLTIAAGGLVILRGKAGWRVKSNIFYGREREVSQLRARLLYQMPAEVTADQLAQISRDYEAVKDRFGTRMLEAVTTIDESNR